MNHQTADRQYDDTPRKRWAHLVPASLLLLFVGTGCSDEFKACVAEFQECKRACPPTVEDEQEILAAAEAARGDCLSQCPPLPGGGNCIARCLEEFEIATELVGCNDACDAALQECVDANTPAGPPVRIAQQVSPNVFLIDPIALMTLQASPLRALQGVSFVPLSLESGAGFVIQDVNPGAVVAQLGGVEGDIFAGINDNPVTERSYQAALGDLVADKPVTVTLLRDNALLKLTYRLR